MLRAKEQKLRDVNSWSFHLIRRESCIASLCCCVSYLRLSPWSDSKDSNISSWITGLQLWNKKRLAKTWEWKSINKARCLCFPLLTTITNDNDRFEHVCSKFNFNYNSQTHKLVFGQTLADCNANNNLNMHN